VHGNRAAISVAKAASIAPAGKIRSAAAIASSKSPAASASAKTLPTASFKISHIGYISYCDKQSMRCFYPKSKDAASIPNQTAPNKNTREGCFCFYFPFFPPFLAFFAASMTRFASSRFLVL
jgi:hypothetical protein